MNKQTDLLGYRGPAGPRGQIHLLHRWKDRHHNSLHEKMEAATPKIQPVGQLPQTEQTRAGYSVENENWAQQTSCPHVQPVQSWPVWDVPVQCRCHDFRISTTALPVAWCCEVGHVARNKTTEGQALWQPGGAKEYSRFHAGNRHPRLA